LVLRQLSHLGMHLTEREERESRHQEPYDIW
jgi:hypothetical protein